MFDRCVDGWWLGGRLVVCDEWRACGERERERHVNDQTKEANKMDADWVIEGRVCVFELFVSICLLSKYIDLYYFVSAFFILFLLLLLLFYSLVECDCVKFDKNNNTNVLHQRWSLLLLLKCVIHTRISISKHTHINKHRRKCFPLWRVVVVVYTRECITNIHIVVPMLVSYHRFPSKHVCVCVCVCAICNCDVDAASCIAHAALSSVTYYNILMQIKNLQVNTYTTSRRRRRTKSKHSTHTNTRIQYWKKLYIRAMRFVCSLKQTKKKHTHTHIYMHIARSTLASQNMLVFISRRRPLSVCLFICF